MKLTIPKGIWPMRGRRISWKIITLLSYPPTNGINFNSQNCSYKSPWTLKIIFIRATFFWVAISELPLFRLCVKLTKADARFNIQCFLGHSARRALLCGTTIQLSESPSVTYANACTFLPLFFLLWITARSG